MKSRDYSLKKIFINTNPKDTIELFAAALDELIRAITDESFIGVDRDVVIENINETLEAAGTINNRDPRAIKIAKALRDILSKLMDNEEYENQEEYIDLIDRFLFLYQEDTLISTNSSPAIAIGLPQTLNNPNSTSTSYITDDVDIYGSMQEHSFGMRVRLYSDTISGSIDSAEYLMGSPNNRHSDDSI